MRFFERQINALTICAIATLGCDVEDSRVESPDASADIDQVCQPVAETCDGLDNNCDGEIDEDVLNACGGCMVLPNLPGDPCDNELLGDCFRAGTYECVGTEIECEVDFPIPSADDAICDGVDSDCDGVSDEEYVEVVTSCGVGACARSGFNLCVGGVTNDTCVPGDPADEICDGLDNNCDGEADEGLGSATCGISVCEHTVDNCLDGVPQVCDPLEGAVAEICDGLDNDCNGEVDEGVLNACGGCGTLAGAPGSPCDDELHPGPCGVWSCSPDLSAVVCADDDSVDEICDGLDNNCDGETDNGIPGGPMIVITSFEPVCSSGSQPVAGIVCNVDNPADFRVALYILVDSGWWTKPYFTAPLRIIDADRRWSSPINTGGCDRSAVRIRAYLVPVGYDPPCAEGSPVLAPELEDNALDFDEVDRARRHVEFAGYSWEVKESCGCALEPGPCRFTDSPDHLWVDESGQLHLTIKYNDPYFYCTEVVLREPLGYGQYRWDLLSDVSDLDPNVVFAGFVYRYFTNAEFDIEFSRGLANPFNTQYVVQPWDQSGHLERWDMPLCNASSHALRWCRGYVHFESRCLDADSAWDGRSWTFEEAGSFQVPTPTIEHPRINAWLISNQPPTDGQDVEIVVADFGFTPLESLPPVPIVEIPDGKDNDCDGEVDE